MTNDFSDFNALPGQFGTDPLDHQSARFVVLFHTHPTDHWDWMFESGGTLLTLRSQTDPIIKGNSGPFPMAILAPHRMDYLDYEGPVSRNRGSVKRLEKGLYRWIEREPHRWVLELAGANLKGILTLQAEKSQELDGPWEGNFVPFP